MRLACIPATLGLALLACRSIPGSAPVGVIARELCVADPADPQGVWWWEPGRSGCASRSTGPGVFHADHATVTATSVAGSIGVGFQLQLIRGPGIDLPDFVDVRLVLEDGGMRVLTSGARVPTARRSDLDVPESPPVR